MYKREAPELGDWITDALDTIGQAAKIGEQVATTINMPKIQAARVDIAKAQAATAASTAQAAETALKLKQMEEAAAAAGSGDVKTSTGTKISSGLLIGGGAALLGLAWLLSKKGR